MRIKIFAAALIASTAIAAPAFAQDSTFTGPRAEAVVGWDHIGDSPLDEGVDGVAYGGQVGYDFQAGSAVLGVEGEVTGSTSKKTVTDLAVAGDSASLSAGRDFYAGARVGFTVGDRALIYAKGGYTNARINARYTSGTTNINDHETLDGWRLGAGTEIKLNDKMYLKGEYRYSQYDNNIEVKRHQVVGGVGVRF